MRRLLAGGGRGGGRGRGEGRSWEGGSPLPTPPELGPGGNAPTLRLLPALPRPLYGRPGITCRPPQPPPGTARGCLARSGSPESAAPAPAPGGDAFEEKRCPLPRCSDAPDYAWSRLLLEKGVGAGPPPPPAPPRCWRFAGPIPAGCDGRLPLSGGRGQSLGSPRAAHPRGRGLSCRPPAASPVGTLTPPGPSPRPS